MAQNNLHIKADNFTEWMASTGFLFPRTVLELSRFEKLYDDVQEDLSGSQVDPEVILGRKPKTKIISIKPKEEEQSSFTFRMVARKGEGNIPKHILDKIKKNQDKRNQDDNGPKKDKPE